MTTKERIMDEALTLFAAKGYNGVTVKDIAGAVGIKDSSLYKHYKSKQEIFDTIVSEVGEHMGEMSTELKMPEATGENVADFYMNIGTEGLVALSKHAFLFYLKDPFVGRFRRMMTMEQYRSPELFQAYRHIFMESSIEYMKGLFEKMLEAGALRGEDAEVMAGNFYMPIFFLLAKYDNQPEKEQTAVMTLEKHVREFVRIYGMDSLK